MDLSGIIFVMLALAWAVYLVPKALKHHDEVSRSKSVERFSTTMRVLARREPVNRRTARLVVTPARRTGRLLLPSRTPVDAEHMEPESASGSAASSDVLCAGSPAAVRVTARSAARRRRRVLGLLVLVTAVVATLAALAVVPWWAVAVPGALVVLYLVLCRTLVRRERSRVSVASPSRRVGPPMPDHRREAGPRRGNDDRAGRPAARVEADGGAARSRESASPAERLAASTHATQTYGEVSPDDDTIRIPVADLGDAVTVPGPAPVADAESLWDPLPVTLPTYVGKARAVRTFRTIDLGVPGAWTSGHDEGDTALVEEAGVVEGKAKAEDKPRAVGS